MLSAFTRAAGQLGDPAIVRILVRSLLVTLLIFAALGALAAWALAGVDPCGWWGEESCALGVSASGLGALLATALLLWLLFPAVAIGVVSAYMDEVVGAVERCHYPRAAATARSLGWGRLAWIGLRSSLRVFLYNLIALPLYLVLLVTGVGTLIAIVVVNGIAFGRDLGELVAARHLDRAGVRLWLRESRGARAVLGMIVTALFLVPVVNLIVPVLAAATATHLFHETRRLTVRS
ncbi:EI24 domain-containing protein [Sphingomonas sp.]|uniref:EI24 domain-containing protein n=1 Tax=Sphingomonas sp. TaxID=28214 RepID=UPI003AFF7DA3